MQLTARLVQILPAESGMGKNGEWKKQSVIVESEGQYPKKICITVWGDKFNITQWQPGQPLAIDFDIESREFNGRWYTDVKAWKIEPVGDSHPNMRMPEPPAYSALPDTPPPPPAVSDFEDLPF